MSKNPIRAICVPVIGFAPPMVGLDGEFNTFRIGLAMSKRLTNRGKVYLMDTKTMTVFGEAKVGAVFTGKLAEMCELHGHMNHTELHQHDGNHAERLLSLITKLYGPHIVTPNKGSTVIYLRRTK